MNKRMILSGGVLVFMAAIVAGGTGAFFSDTETSTGNVFTAGSVSVTLDSLTHQYYGDETAIDSDYFTVRDASGEAPSFRFNDLKPGDTGLIEKGMTNGANDAFWCARNTLVDSDSPFIDRLKLRVNTGNGLTAGQFYNAPFDEWYTLDTSNPTNPGGPGLAVDAGESVTLDLEYCLGDFVNGVVGAPGSAGTSCVVDTSIDWNPLQNQEIEVDVEYYAVQQRNNQGFECGDLNTPVVDQRPLVGAALDSYDVPANEDTIVVENESIQAVVNSASPNQTILVADGTYEENVIINVEGLTIAAVNQGGAIIDGEVRVNAENVTVAGFEILGEDNVASFGTHGVYIVGGSDGVTISHNVIDGTGRATGARGVHFAAGGTINATVSNNVILNWNSSGTYLNPTTGPVTITNNDYHTNNVGIGTDGISNVAVTLNDFAGNTAEAMGVAGDGSTITINQNNFTPAGGGNDVNAYASVTGVDATGNFWDGEVEIARTNSIGDIDTTGEEASAFSTN